ncbi:MAG: hypothetical protein AAFR49_19760, partial [Pseudomonadota bacterium]
MRIKTLSPQSEKDKATLSSRLTTFPVATPLLAEHPTTEGRDTDHATLPMQIFAMIRFGVTPEINALATLV